LQPTNNKKPSTGSKSQQKRNNPTNQSPHPTPVTHNNLVLQQPPTHNKSQPSTTTNRNPPTGFKLQQKSKSPQTHDFHISAQTTHGNPESKSPTPTAIGAQFLI
jgi:hypothetical protein